MRGIIQFLVSDIDYGSVGWDLGPIADFAHDKALRELPRIRTRGTIVVRTRGEPWLRAVVVHAHCAKLVRTALALVKN